MEEPITIRSGTESRGRLLIPSEEHQRAQAASVPQTHYITHGNDVLDFLANTSILFFIVNIERKLTVPL